MAKKKINNYKFKPGIGYTENLYPNAYALLTANKAFIQAEIIKATGEGLQGQQPQENVPGINPQDPSGGGAGNIGVGAAPLPEEQGFSGVPRQTPGTPPDFGGVQ